METTPKGKGSMAADGMASVKVEEHDGSYDCLLCSESVRGTEARHCSACSVQPWHEECGPGLIACPQCARDTTVKWKGRFVVFLLSFYCMHTCECIHVCVNHVRRITAVAVPKRLLTLWTLPSTTQPTF